MSKEKHKDERVSLECGWCGGPAIYGDEDDLFQQDDEAPCLTCGVPGRVEIEDYTEYSDDDLGEISVAYWVTRDDDPRIEAAWRRDHPDKTHLGPS